MHADDVCLLVFIRKEREKQERLHDSLERKLFSGSMEEREQVLFRGIHLFWI